MRAPLAASLVFAFAAQAQAQDSIVTTMAKSAKVGFEFKAELKRDDHGLQKLDGAKAPDASTTIETTRVRLKLGGSINENTEYKFRFNLLNPTKTPLDYGYGTYNFTDMLSFSLGKMKVLQGGWDHLDNGVRDHAQGFYTNSFFFDSYEPMLVLAAKAAGKVQVQILNDVAPPSTKAVYNKTVHPTFVVGWTGDIAGISPIVDFGTADNQKSNWVDVGVKADLAGARLGVDFRQANQTFKNPTDPKKDSKNVKTAVTVKAAYAVEGVVTPGVYFSTYDVKQSTDGGAKDAKANKTFDANGDLKPEWDDNGRTIAVHADVTALGKGWTPYLALVQTSGNFAKSATDAKEVARSNILVRLGVMGEF